MRQRGQRAELRRDRARQVRAGEDEPGQRAADGASQVGRDAAEEVDELQAQLGDAAVGIARHTGPPAGRRVRGLPVRQRANTIAQRRLPREQRRALLVHGGDDGASDQS